MKTMLLEFTAGQVIHAPGGNSFYLLSTTGAVDIEYINKAGTPLNESAVAVEAGYWAQPDGGFNVARITSATAQTIKVGISKGVGGYDRSVGVSQIIGGSDNLANPPQVRPGLITENKNVFSAYDAAGQLASNYAYVQLLNPAASGKLLRVIKCTGFIYQGTAGIVIVTTETGGVVPDSSGVEGNHYIGEATPVAQVSEKTSTTNFCTAPLSHFLNGGWSDPLHPPVDLIIPEAPVIVPEGEALVIKTIVTNKALLANFIWEEVDV